MAAAQTYAEFRGPVSARDHVRAGLRDLALHALSIGRYIDKDSDWIRFPYYHHIFEDERRGFERQLNYLGNFGEFVGPDAAIAMLSDRDLKGGRYFCLGFDDGFKSCARVATPILAERGIPAIFYVVTDMVGRSLAPDDDLARRVFGYRGRDASLDFVSWDDCRAMTQSGMTIGSHTRSHPHLAALSDEEARAELEQSKAEIESRTGTACRHFCAPYGRAETDYLPARDPALARFVGYLSFGIGTRGPNRPGDDPFAFKRDHLLAGWGNHQLRYFLSLP